MIKTQITGIGDPFVLYDGKQYYLYATGGGVKGFKVWISNDLQEWTDGGVALDMSDSWAVDSFWAPEVVKRKDGKYIMHFTARRAKDKSLRLAVAEADTPKGPFRQVKNQPMFDFGYAVIDGHVFVDDDGKAYFYYSRDCSENIVDGNHVSQTYVVRLSDDLTEVVGEPKLLITPTYAYEYDGDGSWRWNEGPAVLKKEGLYFLFYSANFYASEKYCVCVAVSYKPDGEFVKPDYNPVLDSSMAKEFSGPGHNAFFVDAEGKLKTSFHIHTDPKNPSGNRRACIADVEYENGRFFIRL